MLVVLAFGRSMSQGVILAGVHVPALHPARLRDRPGRSTASASAARRQAASRGRADVHRRAGAGELLPRSAATARTGRSSSTRATRPEKLLGAIDALGVKLDGDPAHAHALRPRGRGGAGGEGDRRRGLGAGDRGLRAGGHHELRAVAGLRPVRVLRRRAHAVRRRAARAGRVRDRRALHARPQPRPRDVLDPRRAGVFSGDVLFQGSVGRTDLPGGDWPTLLESIRGLVDSLPEETAVYPGHMGITTPGRRAGDATRSWPSWPRWREAPGAAGHVRRAARGRAPPARARGARRRAARRARATSRSRRPSSRTPSCSRAGWGSPPTSSRRRCSPSRTRRAARSRCAPRPPPAICRAYVEHGMHKLPQPVKLWYWRPVLPPRGAAGRPLPPVHADRRRGARLRRPVARRRADPAARRAPRARRHGPAAAAAVEPRHPGDARRVPRGAEGLTSARARPSCPRRCAHGSTRTRCAPSTPTTRARRP